MERLTAEGGRGVGAPSTVRPTMTADDCTPQSGENVSEELSDDELGASVANIGSVESETAVDIAREFEESSIKVKSSWFDDEPGLVELEVSMLSGHMTISLDPEQGAALASKLSSAAAYADGGETDE